MYPSNRRSRTQPPLWLAVALSLLCHAGVAGLWLLWNTNVDRADDEQTAAADTPATDPPDERPDLAESVRLPSELPLEVAAVREQDLPDDVRRAFESPPTEPEAQPELEPGCAYT